VFVPGKRCSTIYPYNPKERHLWLTVTVSGSGEGMPEGGVKLNVCEVAEALGLAVGAGGPATLSALPSDYKDVLVAVHNFVFGDGSPMCRLWLSCAASGKVGPRQHIVECLNHRVCGKAADEALALMTSLTEQCMAIPWPHPGFTCS
jgi:hypothetical protein